jgi:hypothetical protein
MQLKFVKSLIVHLKILLLPANLINLIGLLGKYQKTQKPNLLWQKVAAPRYLGPAV